MKKKMKLTKKNKVVNEKNNEIGKTKIFNQKINIRIKVI